MPHPIPGIPSANIPIDIKQEASRGPNDLDLERGREEYRRGYEASQKGHAGDENQRTGGRKGPHKGEPSGKTSKGDRDVERVGDGVDREAQRSKT